MSDQQRCPPCEILQRNRELTANLATLAVALEIEHRKTTRARAKMKRYRESLRTSRGMWHANRRELDEVRSKLKNAKKELKTAKQQLAAARASHHRADDAVRCLSELYNADYALTESDVEHDHEHAQPPPPYVDEEMPLLEEPAPPLLQEPAPLVPVSGLAPSMGSRSRIIDLTNEDVVQRINFDELFN